MAALFFFCVETYRIKFLPFSNWELIVIKIYL